MTELFNQSINQLISILAARRPDS